MSYRYHGRASVDANNPAAWATCDRCGSLRNLRDLTWQLDWRGSTMANLKLLVCPRCLDRPSPWYRSLLLPPDPPPIQNARPEPYTIDETDYIYLENGAGILTTESGVPLVMESSGVSLCPETSAFNMTTYDVSIIRTSSGDNIVTAS